jgi:hypothetical protein
MVKKPKSKRKTPGQKKLKEKIETSEQVYCQRIQEPVSVDEHKKCAYCFGTVEAVVEGNHEEFCDYDPDRDPLQFGFPFK